MGALTQAEAQTRFAQLAVDAYDVALDLGEARDQATFGSQVRITFRATTAGPTWVEVKAEALDDE